MFESHIGLLRHRGFASFLPRAACCPPARCVDVTQVAISTDGQWSFGMTHFSARLHKFNFAWVVSSISCPSLDDRSPNSGSKRKPKIFWKVFWFTFSFICRSPTRPRHGTHLMRRMSIQRAQTRPEASSHGAKAFLPERCWSPRGWLTVARVLRVVVSDQEAPRRDQRSDRPNRSRRRTVWDPEWIARALARFAAL